MTLTNLNFDKIILIVINIMKQEIAVPHLLPAEYQGITEEQMIGMHEEVGV